jgi:hypothetical protein
MTDPQLANFIAKHNVTVLNGTRIGEEPKPATMTVEELSDAEEKLFADDITPVFVRVGADYLRVTGIEDAEDEQGNHAIAIVTAGEEARDALVDRLIAVLTARTDIGTITVPELDDAVMLGTCSVIELARDIADALHGKPAGVEG